eukprot:TRINITY_DN32636_c0_g1_i1.p2 TRINITY_DN32636_c0_g1~~TRINITY_DN32636_c0_g1_i1.p2  ORF type:complete len:116 (+),score=14.17 TRINITY_DN32636_c0_g1_i1:282-629(+)
MTQQHQYSPALDGYAISEPQRYSQALEHSLSSALPQAGSCNSLDALAKELSELNATRIIPSMAPPPPFQPTATPTSPARAGSPLLVRSVSPVIASSPPRSTLDELRAELLALQAE